MMSKKTVMAFFCLMCAYPFWGTAQNEVGDGRSGDVNYVASLLVNAGKGDFAPYYIASNRYGTITQQSGAYLRLSADRPLALGKRFSWSIGGDAITGLSSYTDYQRYDAASGAMVNNRQRPSAIWLQQLYGTLKWRQLFLELGMKEQKSALFNNRLGSGDYVNGRNARPIPGFRVGFIDFQDIPFTKGALQIQGEIAYGKTTDKDWLLDHHNQYNSFASYDSWYHYKRLYFRTSPKKPLSVTFGMQAAGQFAGSTNYYRKGEMTGTSKRKLKLRDFWDMLVTKGDGVYYKGNHLGAWDLKAVYKLRRGEVAGYFQWPWEDGSGIGKLNGFDGIWGLEWKQASRGIISEAVLEVFTFMNQSGPFLYAPGDHPGTNLPEHTDGGDDYYNNHQYNGYAHHGMGLGSPLLPSPLYNLDGYMRYVDTRLRGFHIGLSGSLNEQLDYRILAGYKKGFGTLSVPRKSPGRDTSLLLEATWRTSRIPGLVVNAQVGMDWGTIYGNQYGALAGVVYQGILDLW